MSDNTEKEILEERKVRALEKIALGVDGISLWLEEIDKHGWDERVQFYLHEFMKKLDEKKDA
jgi:hypothetical protein